LVKVKISTFNCENLFARYKFKADVDTDKAIKDGWLPHERFFHINNETEKKLTAEAIKETKADVIALQEVENFQVLKRFRKDYLQGTQKYKYICLVEGNDPRLIDIAVLSKYPIEKIDTHVHEYDTKLRMFTFSRDCLECNIVIPGTNKKIIRLYVNHFKSMMDKSNPCKGREATRKKRIAQSKRVKEIVSEEISDINGNVDFVILGDLNDYPETDEQGSSGITELVTWDKVENVIYRLPAEEQWTHYFKGNASCNIPEAYTQLDYILISKSLAGKNKDKKPKIIRNGLPLRADKYKGDRFKGVGKTIPKSSDHCPMVIELEV
jgi:predicted extracellular nuclease